MKSKHSLPRQRKKRRKTDCLPVALSAGPLHLLYENGMVRSIRYGGIEIIRRIYFALRDRHWNTVPYIITSQEIETDDASFSIRLEAQHQENSVDFRWTGLFTGTSDGRITLSFKGHSATPFLRNRIGWCILHPLALCKDAPCSITLDDGSIVDKSFPGNEISPHQPFPPFSALSYPIISGVECHCSFEGDLFETEDQRNWTDATFKTYSTPQSLPSPVQVSPDETISQKVIISVSAHENLPAPPSPAAAPVTVDFPALTSAQKPRPRIGIGISMNELLHLDPAEISARMPVDHFRLDIDAAMPLSRQLSSRVIAWCSRYLTEMEIALYLTDNFEEECRAVAALLAPCAPFIARVLLLHRDVTLSRNGVLLCAGEAFSYLENPSRLFVGTDRYFVELNRANIPEASPAGICFSANPQVHTFDDCVIMENLEGLGEVLGNARRIAGTRPVALSPLTLRPRINPQRPEKAGGADARQSTKFAAAWFTGALATVLQSSVSSCTFFSSLFGDEGVLRGPGAESFPVYQVLISGVPDNGLCSGTIYQSSEGNVAAVVSRGENGKVLLLANLTSESIRITIPGIPPDAEVAVLEETEGKWSFEKSDLHGSDDFEIEGFGVVRLEF